MSAAAPLLRADLSIIPQVYGGEASFVVKDLAAQKYFRFGDAEVRVMRSFDGRRSAAEIAADLASEGLRISESAVESFARTMASMGFLERTVAERSTLELERLRAERRTGRRVSLFRGELLRMRWSFGDPDAILDRTLPYVAWMFTPWFIAASVAVFGVYLVMLGAVWSDFTAAIVSTYSLSTITFGNVATLWLTGALVILVHELGHAYACKYFGGEVHELGFMLVYFQPAFYCNVSDAWGFQERSARLWVTAAGSWIQLVVASLAAIAWYVAAPGTAIAHVGLAAMLVGGVSTLLTNGNPLLPLDGYFALTDWMEIPNLRLRAFAHFQWWIRVHLLRLELPEPAATARERRVFLTYGALSAAYITLLFVALTFIVVGWAGRAFGAIGVIVTLSALAVLLRTRIREWSRAAALAIRVRRERLRRMRGLALPGAAVLVLLLLVVPWPLTSRGNFVVRPTATILVAAPDSGVVAQVFVTEGMRVATGAPIVRLLDRALDRELLAAGRAIDSLTLAESATRAQGRTGDAARLGAERESAVARLEALARRSDNLTLRAASAGVVASARPEELAGRRVEAGDSLLTLAAIDSVELRIALAGAGATRVRAGQVVQVIPLAGSSEPWTSRIADVSRSGIGAGRDAAVVEARVRRTAGDVWRPGVTGEASVELARSTILGALWWKARQLVRGDLLL